MPVRIETEAFKSRRFREFGKLLSADPDFSLNLKVCRAIGLGFAAEIYEWGTLEGSLQIDGDSVREIVGIVSAPELLVRADLLEKIGDDLFRIRGGERLLWLKKAKKAGGKGGRRSAKTRRSDPSRGGRSDPSTVPDPEPEKDPEDLIASSSSGKSRRRARPEPPTAEDIEARIAEALSPLPVGARLAARDGISQMAAARRGGKIAASVCVSFANGCYALSREYGADELVHALGIMGSKVDFDWRDNPIGFAKAILKRRARESSQTPVAGSDDHPGQIRAEHLTSSQRQAQRVEAMLRAKRDKATAAKGRLDV